MPRVTQALVVSSDYGEPLLASCDKATWFMGEFDRAPAVPDVRVFVEHNGRMVEARRGERSVDLAGRWEEGCGDG